MLGKFYGHSNLAHFKGSGDASEFTYIYTVQVRAPGRRLPWIYHAPLSMVRSAIAGVTEFGSTHLCGCLLNEMIFSDNTDNAVWRLKLGERGAAEDTPFNFMRRGGIRVV